jgi:hypothetical protein
MSSLALNFNNVQFDIVDTLGQVWLKATQIGVALGYADDKAIQRLYSRNSDEFTESMTRVVKLTTVTGGKETRVFSLRGCHLIAMFARTTIAKQFRKWVLDVLDKETQSIIEPNDFITQTLSQISKGNRKLYMSMYNGLIRHFGVGRISDIPASDCAKAIEVMRVYANEWEIKNSGRPAQKLNDGYNFFVVKDGVPIYQKVINGDSSSITPAMINNQPVLLEHIKQVIGEFIGKATLPPPKNNDSLIEVMQSVEMMQGDVDYWQVRDALKVLVFLLENHASYSQSRPMLMLLETVERMMVRLWTMINEAHFLALMLQGSTKENKPLTIRDMDKVSKIISMLGRNLMTLQIPKYQPL